MNSTTSGVYLIFNHKSGKSYIGSTGSSVGFKKRWRYHCQDMIRGEHGNSHLQHAFYKYGIENISFMPIEICKDSMLDERESFWIGRFDSLNPEKGYNLIDPKRRSISDITRLRMSLARKAHKMTDEHKINIGIALLGNSNAAGHIHSEQTREKIKIKAIGRIVRSGFRNPATSIMLKRMHKENKMKFRLSRDFVEFKYLYESGVPYADISDRFGRAMTWAWKTGRRYGLKRGMIEKGKK